MMPGVAAQPLGRSSGGGGIGNSWSLDFLNEVYTKNGVLVLLADIVDKPGRVGASGLEILDNDINGGVFAIGDFLTDLITMNWTIVIEWQQLAGVDYTELFYIWESGSHHHLAIDNTGVGTIDAYDSGPIVREIFNPGSYLTGNHKSALTRTDDNLSVSTDGSAVATDVSAQSLNPMEIATFGGPEDGSSYKGLFVRKVRLIPPASTASLPTLSA